VIIHVRVHRPDQTNIISNASEVRQQLAEFHPTLPLRREFPRTAKYFVGSLGRIVVFHLAGEFLEMVPSEFGFGIEKVHVARTTDHEERNHGPGAGRLLGLSWVQIKAGRLQFRAHGSGQQSVLVKKPRQCHSAPKIEGAGSHEMAAGTKRGTHSM
jgi:hypothetical protein